MSSSQLTRFTQAHDRENADTSDPAAQQTPAPQAEPERRAAQAPQGGAAATSQPKQPQRPAAQHDPLPKTEVVQQPEAQTLRSTQADLYSEAPITISVLKRALPQRFAKAKADNSTVAFKAPTKKNSQLGLTHAIRPLRRLFPFDPS